MRRVYHVTVAVTVHAGREKDFEHARQRIREDPPYLEVLASTDGGYFTVKTHAKPVSIRQRKARKDT